MENLDKLVRELLFLPHETEWVEFKHDNYDPQMIGRDISALANGAALMDKDVAYFIWGIDDKTHEIVGTNYNLHNACELMRLPAPRMDIYEESTKVTLLSETKFSDLSTKDRLWGCYLHACIRYIQGDYLTNRSLRERFGLKDTSAGMVSRIIKEAIAQNLIRPFDQETAPRYMKYIPSWG